MAGLNNAMAPGAAPAPAPAGVGPAPVDPAMDPNAAPAEEGEGMAASPEEQEMYDGLVARAMMLIHDEKTRTVRKSVLQMLEEGEPKQALGETAATIFNRVLQAADDAGMQVPGDIMEAAAAEVFEQLAELATKAGIYDFTADDEAFNGAFYIAADTLRTMMQSDGTLDQEAAAGEFEEIVAMDRDGRLDAVLQGM